MTAQRFAGVGTLQKCAAGTHVMGAGDPDAVAVTRVQEALSDLGYLPADEVDGIFGTRTGKAVTAFKTDEKLSPADPKVGRGTMAALDAAFAAEPADGDAPDPTTAGLDALAAQARTTALGWVGAAQQALSAWPDPPGPGEQVDLARQAYEDSLKRNFHLARTPAEKVYVDVVLDPMLGSLPQVLQTVRFVAQDRATYRTMAATYETSSAFPGLSVHVTPAFRNTLTAVDRAADVLRLSVMFCFPIARTKGWPGTARYAALDTWTALRNSVAWVSFCAEMAGQPATFRPTPRWYV